MAENIIEDSVNTNAMFPHLDQLSESSRDIYVKDHEFQIAIAEMIAQLNTLLDMTNGTSVIATSKANVANALNSQLSEIETISSKVNGSDGWIEQMRQQLVEVQAAFERLYSKIFSDIKSISVNIENRTQTFDSVESYQQRVKHALWKLLQISSAYKDGRADDVNGDDKYTIKGANTTVALRDVDKQGFVTYPVIIKPYITNDEGENITQVTPIKILEFTPVANGTSVPSFLAELIISGDLFSYKGFVSSGAKSPKERGVNFDAEYLINQDLPFSLKVLYDEDTNKVAIAFKFDETNDKFASIVKFDFSVNLLVGKDLEFAEPNTMMTYNR